MVYRVVIEHVLLLKCFIVSGSPSPLTFTLHDKSGALSLFDKLLSGGSGFKLIYAPVLCTVHHATKPPQFTKAKKIKGN